MTYVWVAVNKRNRISWWWEPGTPKKQALYCKDDNERIYRGTLTVEVLDGSTD
jgi:hypothetical protein